MWNNKFLKTNHTPENYQFKTIYYFHIVTVTMSLFQADIIKYRLVIIFRFCWLFYFFWGRNVKLILTEDESYHEIR